MAGLKALWSHGRAYCGQDGCKNRAALTRLAGNPGRVSIGNHWIMDVDTEVFRHAARATFTPAPDPNVTRAVVQAQRAAIRRLPAAREASLPIVMVCPVCNAPNALADPNAMA